MRVLILGGGGREHALAWAVRQSPDCAALFVAPGNPGAAEVAETVDLSPEDLDGVVAFCADQRIDFAIVGPEAPLAAGVADRLAAEGIACFGPSAAAAQLESSKAFTKDICDACGAPTAPWARFTDADAASAHIAEQGAPIVVKADGLAAGKGVVVAETVAEAQAAARDILGGRHGEAGAEIVVEAFMEGEEASFFALSDGARVLPLASAQDHKRALDGDRGPNTGGMGAYSPAPIVTPAVEREVMERIIRPVVAEMARRGTPFRGVLYAGLMIGPQGPRLVEFNVRFGDPECQVMMLRLGSDLLPVLRAAADGDLTGQRLAWRQDAAVTVVMAARGYPGTYAKGEEIRGLEAVGQAEGVTLFHAGTRRDGAALVSNGGRVLNVCATGATVEEARARAYQAVDAIDWPGGVCRRDIALRAVEEA